MSARPLSRNSRPYILFLTRLFTHLIYARDDIPLVVRVYRLAHIAQTFFRDYNFQQFYLLRLYASTSFPLSYIHLFGFTFNPRLYTWYEFEKLHSKKTSFLIIDRFNEPHINSAQLHIDKDANYWRV